MVANRTQAVHDLKPYLDRLRRRVESAIAEFLVEEGHKLSFMEGSKASLVRDYILKHIKAEFPNGEDGISHHTSHLLFVLNIKGRYILRFRKFDGNLKPRYNATQTTLDWLFQQPLVLFPELVDVTHLDVGYKPGATLATSTVWIACPAGKTLFWSISLSEPAEPLELPLAMPPMVPLSPSAARARPKPMPKTEEGDDGPNRTS